MPAGWFRAGPGGAGGVRAGLLVSVRAGAGAVCESVGRGARSWAGTPVRSRVGHSYVRAFMAERDAVFGGEHSGHYYFRDLWRVGPVR